MNIRVGFSKDIHRLVYGRKLILAGVVVPSSLGELAHSDGDVVYHALAESILGALALGDLGKHFPDNLDATKDMDSKIIVQHVFDLMKNANYKIGNIDIFISLEQPKLKDYVQVMRENIANILNCQIDQVSIKAGTNEHLDAVGRCEAIEAYSYVLLKSEGC